MDEKSIEFLAHKHGDYRGRVEYFNAALCEVLMTKIEAMHSLHKLTDLEYFVLTLDIHGIDNKEILQFVNIFISDKSTLQSIRVTKHKARRKFAKRHGRALREWDTVKAPTV